MREWGRKSPRLAQRSAFEAAASAATAKSSRDFDGKACAHAGPARRLPMQVPATRSQCVHRQNMSALAIQEGARTGGTRYRSSSLQFQSGVGWRISKLSSIRDRLTLFQWLARTADVSQSRSGWADRRGATVALPPWSLMSTAHRRVLRPLGRLASFRSFADRTPARLFPSARRSLGFCGQ